MKLITKEIEKKLYNLYETENMNADDIKVSLKLFNPTGVGTWYIYEYDKNTGMAFGICDLGYPEFGYISLKELSAIKFRFGLGVERDLYWDTKTTLKELKDELGV